MEHITHPDLVSAQNLLQRLNSEPLTSAEKIALFKQAQTLLNNFHQQTNDELTYQLIRYQFAFAEKNDTAVEIIGWRLYELTDNVTFIMQLIDYYEFVRGKHEVAMIIAEQLQDFAFSEADRKLAKKKLVQLLG